MWMTYDNLFKWFMSFKAFVLKYGFAIPGKDSKHHPIINEAMQQHIINVNKTKILLNGSQHHLWPSRGANEKGHKDGIQKMSTAKREAFLRVIDKDTGKEDKPFQPNNIKAV